MLYFNRICYSEVRVQQLSAQRICYEETDNLMGALGGTKSPASLIPGDNPLLGRDGLRARGVMSNIILVRQLKQVPDIT